MATTDSSESHSASLPATPAVGSAGLAGSAKGGTKLDCPLRRVLAASEHGLVVESVRGFDVGSSMVLGCHVESAPGSVFVSAETVVVESQRRFTRSGRGSRQSAAGAGVEASGDVVESGDEQGGGRVYQVTLMFSDISGHDRELLMNLSSVDGIRLASGPVARHSGLAIPPPQVLPMSGGTAKGGAGSQGVGTNSTSAGDGQDHDSTVGDAGAPACSLN